MRRQRKTERKRKKSTTQTRLFLPLNKTNFWRLWHYNWQAEIVQKWEAFAFEKKIIIFFKKAKTMGNCVAIKVYKVNQKCRWVCTEKNFSFHQTFFGFSNGKYEFWRRNNKFFSFSLFDYNSRRRSRTGEEKTKDFHWDNFVNDFSWITHVFRR